MDNLPLDKVKPSGPSLIKPLHLIGFMVVIGLAGILLLNHFFSQEEERDLAHWQNTLNLIADSRASDIERWLSSTQDELAAVARNPSLQLYMTTLLAQKTDVPLAEPPAQRVYLRNLLVATVERLGFSHEPTESARTIGANLAHDSGVGLMITDINGTPLVATEGLATPDAVLLKKITDAPKGKISLLDIFTAPGGEMRMGFVLPVYPVQADPIASQQMGMLVGVTPVADTLRKLLVQPGVNESTLEASLIRPQGESVEYMDVRPYRHPVGTMFARTTPHLDGAHALDSPNHFALMRDRLSHAVLMTSRPITGSPWTLLLRIDRDQALAVSEGERIEDEALLAVAWIALMAIIVAAWWYGSSRRATLLSEETAKLAAHSMEQEKLLRLITDSQPAPIFIADQKDIVHFANAKACEVLGITAQDAEGKTLAALMGPAIAHRYSDENDAALKHKKVLSLPFHQMPDGRIIHTQHIPLAHVPVKGLAYPTQGVLIIEHDVTDIMYEREWRERVLKQLVHTLVRMVDARDPYAANHSVAVARLAREVAERLMLESKLVRTAEIAGQLMNIGKMIVPSEMLTRQSSLASQEKQTIGDSLYKSASLLEGIEFEGPVIETLRQAAERVDGSGALGLKGEEILITARIIAAANSFVGMISPRAYRKAMTPEQATEQLLKDIDTQFDRHVVIALVHFSENQQGKEVVEGIIHGLPNHSVT